MWITYEEVAFRRMGSVHEGVWDSNVTSAIWIKYEEVAFDPYDILTRDYLDKINLIKILFVLSLMTLMSSQKKQLSNKLLIN